MESLSSLSEDDSSLDEDFFIVQLPDCFDTSKPLVRISADSYSPFSTSKLFILHFFIEFFSELLWFLFAFVCVCA